MKYLTARSSEEGSQFWIELPKTYTRHLYNFQLKKDYFLLVKLHRREADVNELP